MNLKNEVPVGYKALVDLFKVKCIPHYCWSYITQKGGKRVEYQDNQEIYYYPKDYNLNDSQDPFENLEFAFKYEGLNFEILHGVFNKLPKKEIEGFIKKKPLGKTERKLWYIYEMLTKEKLSIPDLKSGNYIDLLDPDEYYTTDPIKSKRHRVNDNLLGYANFCPFVRKTELLIKFQTKHFDKKAKKLIENYNEQTIKRAALYLFNKETRCSWEIEREQPSQERANKFVKLLEKAANIKSITKKDLIRLQNEIVVSSFANNDWRKQQIYVGEIIRSTMPIIHFIAPKPADVGNLMQEFFVSLDRMIDSNVHPVIIASAISFGFVFIHPFDDGNGRVHRFLIHYILSKTNFTPKDNIFSVSAVILKNMQQYNLILETISESLMALLDYTVKENGAIEVKNNYAYYYAYIDFTKFAEYLFDCIQKTISEELKPELDFIVSYDKTKKAIKEIVDMPDKYIDLIIKFSKQNNGKLSGDKRKKHFEFLKENEIKEIENIISELLLKIHSNKV